MYISEVIWHHIFAQSIPVQYLYWEGLLTRRVSEAFLEERSEHNNPPG